MFYLIVHLDFEWLGFLEAHKLHLYHSWYECFPFCGCKILLHYHRKSSWLVSGSKAFSVELIQNVHRNYSKLDNWEYYDCISLVNKFRNIGLLQWIRTFPRSENPPAKNLFSTFQKLISNSDFRSHTSTRDGQKGCFLVTQLLWNAVILHFTMLIIPRLSLRCHKQLVIHTLQFQTSWYLNKLS